jgi:hypothetical protein
LVIVGVLSKRRGRALRTPTTPRPASASASAMTPTVRLSLNYCIRCPISDALVDLHSNLRLGPIWVKSGTEIETDASFSLNLSANFVALSGESGLLFDCGLPGFDDGV